MSSDSDSDDDIQIKQFLEATDTTLLNNSMFQKKDESVCDLGKPVVNQTEPNQTIKNGINKQNLFSRNYC